MLFYVLLWTLDSNLPTCSETNLGHIDHVAIEKELDVHWKNENPTSNVRLKIVIRLANMVAKMV